MNSSFITLGPGICQKLIKLEISLRSYCRCYQVDSNGESDKTEANFALCSPLLPLNSLLLLKFLHGVGMRLIPGIYYQNSS